MIAEESLLESSPHQYNSFGLEKIQWKFIQIAAYALNKLFYQQDRYKKDT